MSASNSQDRPRLMQVFLVEEGTMADKIVDVFKFQNFWITVVLVAAYVVLAAAALGSSTKEAPIAALPSSRTRSFCFSP